MQRSLAKTEILLLPSARALQVALPGRPSDILTPWLFFFLILFCLFIFERECVHEHGQGRERGGDRGSEAGSVPTAESLMRGSNSQTLRS